MFESGTSKVNISTNGNSYINGGNVGIGLTSPAFTLDVDGVSRSRGVVVNSSFNNNTARPAMSSGLATHAPIIRDTKSWGKWERRLNGRRRWLLEASCGWWDEYG